MEIPDKSNAAQQSPQASERATRRDAIKTNLRGSGFIPHFFSNIPNFIYPWGRADRIEIEIENIVWHLEENGFEFCILSGFCPLNYFNETLL
jgi:hypothetical protein